MHVSYAMLTTAALFVAFCATAHAAEQECPVPPNVSMRSIFSNYSLGGVDWDALADPQNDALLKACLPGATRAELAQLGVSDFEKRIRTLEQGHLIKQNQGRYGLNFPAIVADRHAELHSAIGPAASALLPTTREIAAEIRPHLKDNEEMLYHLVWSWVMDGHIAWSLLEAQLRTLLQKDSIDLATCWWLYPGHPYHVGTNTYIAESAGLLAISWSHSTIAPYEIRSGLCAHENRFLLSTIKHEPIPPDEITNELRAYGFIAETGRSRLFLLDPSAPVAPVVLRSSARFAQLAMKHMNVPQIARQLSLTPEQTLVIAYHELCYELLGRLDRSGDLEIPQISKDDPQVTRWLVSLVPIRSEAQRQQLEALAREIIQQYAPGQSNP